MSFRSSDYWDEFSDEDLEYRIRSFEALKNNCDYEVDRMKTELEKRKGYDASISRL